MADNGIEYSRALTALSMAAAEVYQLRDELRKQAAAFRQRADAIDELLTTGERKSMESGIDGWLVAIKSEDAEYRKARNAATPSPATPIEV